MSQLERLYSAYKSRPNDAFLCYAIAMEHLKLSEITVALDKFSALIKSHPNYIPTYLQFGNTLAENGQIEAALEILKTGSKIAIQAGDAHTASEIMQAIEMLE